MNNGWRNSPTGLEDPWTQGCLRRCRVMFAKDVTSVSTSSRYLCFRCDLKLFVCFHPTLQNALTLLHDCPNGTPHTSFLRLDRANSIDRGERVALDRSYNSQDGSCTARVASWWEYGRAHEHCALSDRRVVASSPPVVV